MKRRPPCDPKAAFLALLDELRTSRLTTGGDWLARLVDVIRPRRREAREEAGPRLRALAHVIESRPDLAAAFRDADVALICVGTPGHGNGSLDLSYVRRVCEQIGAALKETDEYKVVVVRSTMLPGSMASVVIPALEGASRAGGARLDPQSHALLGDLRELEVCRGDPPGHRRRRVHLLLLDDLREQLLAPGRSGDDGFGTCGGRFLDPLGSGPLRERRIRVDDTAAGAAAPGVLLDAVHLDQLQPRDSREGAGRVVHGAAEGGGIVGVGLEAEVVVRGDLEQREAGVVLEHDAHEEAAVPVALVDAIEFYHAGFDHYFLTANGDEILALDTGYFTGWARTGEKIRVFEAGSFNEAPVRPVCRYYGLPSAGLDSHFYSADPAECFRVNRDFGTEWQVESGNVFQIALPDKTTGDCPIAGVPVYRVFNHRSDANHRYTTKTAIRTQMELAGWIREGDGPDAVIMCAMPPPQD